MGYATWNNTAASGLNYTTTSGTLTFNDGQSSATFNVPLLYTPATEGDLTFYVRLQDPTGGASLGVTNYAQVTIQDGITGIYGGPTDDTITLTAQADGSLAYTVVRNSDQVVLGSGTVAALGSETASPGSLDPNREHPLVGEIAGVGDQFPCGVRESGLHHLPGYRGGPKGPPDALLRPDQWQGVVAA